MSLGKQLAMHCGDVTGKPIDRVWIAKPLSANGKLIEQLKHQENHRKSRKRLWKADEKILQVVVLLEQTSVIDGGRIADVIATPEERLAILL